MKSKRIYVDVHVLQTVPPSCVNRDDTGSPKTAVYGGVTRARVSSQSWKKAVRLMFHDIFPADDLSLRTKKIVGMVSEEMLKLGIENSDKAAQSILTNAGLKMKSADKGTDAMFFMSHAQARALAKLAKEKPETLDESLSATLKKEVHNALKDNPGIEIALFGRMVADDPSLNTDACAQVAHALSTHKVSNEYDYFTAADDLASEDNAGAGHIGTVEFNSSTLYRYATVAVHALHEQLDQDTASAVRGFVQAFVLSMPTGKQNTFANRTLPDAVLITLREDQPINLVGAFEKPVHTGDSGYIEPSAKRFMEHTRRVYLSFAGEPKLSLVSGELFSELGQCMTFDRLLVTLEKTLQNELNGDVTLS